MRGGLGLGTERGGCTPGYRQVLRYLPRFAGSIPRAEVRLRLDLPATGRPRGHAGPALQGRAGDLSPDGFMPLVPEVLQPGTAAGVTLHRPGDPPTMGGTILWEDPRELGTPSEPIAHGFRYAARGSSPSLALARSPAKPPARRWEQRRLWGRLGSWALVGIVTLLLLGQARPGSAAESEAPGGRATVKRDGVPMYSEMAITSKVGKVLQRGEVVTVNFALVTAEGAWCYIAEAGRPASTGYVRCEDIEREPPSRERQAPPAPPAAAPPSQPSDRTGVPPGLADLINATVGGQTEKAKALIAQGVNVNGRTPGGYTALMYAALDAHTDILDALLAVGADMQARTAGEGLTALMLASLGPHATTVRRLLAAGAHPNARDRRGATPLMVAAGIGNAAIVEALLAAGADVHARTSTGGTALMAAKRKGHNEIVRLLRGAGARE